MFQLNKDLYARYLGVGIAAIFIPALLISALINAGWFVQPFLNILMILNFFLLIYIAALHYNKKAIDRWIEELSLLDNCQCQAYIAILQGHLQKRISVKRADLRRLLLANLSCAYYVAGDFNNAMQYGQMALQCQVKKKDSKSDFYIRVNLALLYAEIEDRNSVQAVRKDLEALYAAETNGDNKQFMYERLIPMQFLLACKEGRLAEAESYYRTVLPYAPTRLSQVKISCILADIALQKGDAAYARELWAFAAEAGGDTRYQATAAARLRDMDEQAQTGTGEG